MRCHTVSRAHPCQCVSEPGDLGRYVEPMVLTTLVCATTGEHLASRVAPSALPTRERAEVGHVMCRKIISIEREEVV